MDYEKMGFSKEEFEQANAMFAGMMQGMDAAAPQPPTEEAPAPSPSDEAAAQPAPAANANPFTQGYQGLQGNLATGPTGMPQLPENIGEIMQDPEFQNFFQDFATQMAGGSAEDSKEEGGPDMSGQKEMIDGMMKEF